MAEEAGKAPAFQIANTEVAELTARAEDAEREFEALHGDWASE